MSCCRPWRRLTPAPTTSPSLMALTSRSETSSRWRPLRFRHQVAGRRRFFLVRALTHDQLSEHRTKYIRGGPPAGKARSLRPESYTHGTRDKLAPGREHRGSILDRMAVIPE